MERTIIDGTQDEPGEKKIDLRKTANLRSYDPIPKIEWWDAQFLPPTSIEGDEALKRFPDTDVSDTDIYLDKITHYI